MKMLYTGSFRFPDKDAASQRVLGIAKALKEGGAQVVFCGWEQSGRSEDYVNGEFVYQGFPYHSQSELDNKGNKFKKFADYLFLGSRTMKWIRTYHRTNEISHIIVYNSNSLFILSLYLYCKKKGIKLIADCTEWYEGSHLPGGPYGPINLDNNIRIKLLYPLVRNVIAISSYLKNFLEQKGGNVIVVPPLIDLTDKRWSAKSEHRRDKKIKRLIYAGSPGKKDLLMPVIEALADINKVTVKAHFSIVGLDEKELMATYRLSDVPSYIFCTGRLPLQEVAEMYTASDFSIILREDKRYAHAGFPTKFVESLAMGVPVIANITSDIGSYLEDDVNGFVIEKLDTDAVVKALSKAADVTEDKLNSMKDNAKAKACQSFDYNSYTRELSDFLLS